MGNITILVVKPMELPYAVEVDADDLSTMQGIVGGSLEAVPYKGRYYLWCNEDGKRTMPPNRVVGELRDVIHGAFFLTGGADRYGGTTGLTQFDVELLKQEF